MDVNGLNKLQNTDYLSKVADTASAAAAKTNTAKTDASSAEGVIYDKSSSTTTGTDYKTNNAALIQKLKQDSEDRINQLKDIVSQMMTKQGTAIGKADDISQAEILPSMKPQRKKRRKRSLRTATGVSNRPLTVSLILQRHFPAMILPKRICS